MATKKKSKKPNDVEEVEMDADSDDSDSESDGDNSDGVYNGNEVCKEFFLFISYADDCIFTFAGDTS